MYFFIKIVFIFFIQKPVEVNKYIYYEYIGNYLNNYYGEGLFSHNEFKIYKNETIKSNEYLKNCKVRFYVCKFINYVLLINFAANLISNVQNSSKTIKLFK
jgi:hypothetical protein